MRSVVVFVLLALASPASAQPGLTDPIAPSVQPNAQHVPEIKSGGLAVALSMGATLGAIAITESNPGLGVAGLMLGPSLGRWYNHEFGGIGLAGRLVGAFVILKGIEKEDRASECEGTTCSGGGGMIYAGIIIWGAATIYDFVEAGRGSDRYNKKHAMRVAPTMLNQHTAGLSLDMQF